MERFPIGREKLPVISLQLHWTACKISKQSTAVQAGRKARVPFSRDQPQGFNEFCGCMI